jgi:hypothetical protein
MTKTDVFVRINPKGSLTSTEPFIRTNGVFLYLMILGKSYSKQFIDFLPSTYTTTIFDFQSFLNSIDFDELAAGYERELSETRKHIKKYEEQLSKEEEEKYKNPYTIDNLNYYKKELEKFNIVLEIIKLGKKLKELQ